MPRKEGRDQKCRASAAHNRLGIKDVDIRAYEKNDKLDIRYRRISNSLVVSGLGVIFFGLWSVIKVFAEMALGELDLFGFLMSDLEDTWQMRLMMYAVFVAVIAFVVLLHYYIGLCAIRVGTGKKNRYLYLILAVFLLALDIFGFLPYFKAAEMPQNQVDVTIASLFVDIANCAAVINLIMSSIIYYSLKKTVGED